MQFRFVKFLFDEGFSVCVDFEVGFVGEGVGGYESWPADDYGLAQDILALGVLQK